MTTTELSTWMVKWRNSNFSQTPGLIYRSLVIGSNRRGGRIQRACNFTGSLLGSAVSSIIDRWRRHFILRLGNGYVRSVAAASLDQQGGGGGEVGPIVSRKYLYFPAVHVPFLHEACSPFFFFFFFTHVCFLPIRDFVIRNERLSSLWQLATG